jgi:hypothetical protein
MAKFEFGHRNRAAWTCACSALLLALATLICSLPSFRYDFAGSTHPVTDRQPIRLSPPPGRSRLSLALDGLKPPGFVALSLTLAAKSPLADSHRVAARFFLVPRHQGGELDWEAAKRITRLPPDIGPTVFTQRLYLGEGVEGLSLVGWMESGGAVVELMDLRTDFLVETPRYRIARLLLGVLWTGLGIATARVLMRAGDRLPYVALAGVVGLALFAGTLMPKSIVRAGTSVLKDVIVATRTNVESLVSPTAIRQPTPPRGPDQRKWLIEPEKVAHFSLCFLLAVCARRGFGSRHPVSIFLVLLAIAATTEVLQTMTVDRDPSVEDVGVDAMGLIAGLLLTQVVGSAKRSARLYAGPAKPALIAHEDRGKGASGPGPRR